MKKISVILIICSLPFISYAQTSEASRMMSGYTLPKIENIPLKSPKYKGNYYLNEEFKIAQIETKQGHAVPNVFYRYDLLNEILEIKDQEKDLIKIDVSHIDKITVYPNGKLNLINTQNFEKEMYGLFSILSENSESMLVEKSYIDIIKANYDPALNVGSKDHKYVKKSKLYYIHRDRIEQREFKRSYKSLSKSTGQDTKTIKAYCRTNNIDIDKDDDLLRLLDQYSGAL